jgi:hypothetical protein
MEQAKIRNLNPKIQKIPEFIFWNPEKNPERLSMTISNY